MTDYNPFVDDTPYFSGADGGASLRAASLKCVVCGSKYVVYAIDKPSGVYPLGAYCYICLLHKIMTSGICPTPIGTELLDQLKASAKFLTFKQSRA